MKKELHVLVGCADARDLNQVQIDSVAQTQKEFMRNGIRIDFQVIRAAGSFISNDVFEDIRNILLQYMKSDIEAGDEVSYYVHIQTHGHLTPESNTDYVSHIYEMKIVDGSPLNCGMLGASGVGIEIEQLLIEKKLEYKTPGGNKKIEHDEQIREFLHDVYAYDGYLAGDWIKSIDYLRTHPRAQKAKLERLFENDPDLKRLGIKITAGIQDYGIHALIRVDGGIPEVPFWDNAQQLIRMGCKEHITTLKKQAEKQKPMAGLLCMSDPRATSRTLAAEYYHKLKNHDYSEGYLPNTIFNITGSTFDITETPFGPYVIAGFYYAVKYLQLTDQMIMGYDKKQTDRILLKIKNDPLMNLVVNSFNVNLIPIRKPI